MVLPSSHTRSPVLYRAGLNTLLASLLAATLLAPPDPAMAQPASTRDRNAPVDSAHRADPLNPQAAVPPWRHPSAFAAYRRLSDTPVGDWRQANDTVTKIGGWRAYAREAQAPQSAPGGAPHSATHDAPAGAAPK